MLRRIIIIAAVVFVPITFYFASLYGDLDTVTFEKAIETAATASEGDKAPSVIVVTTIVAIQGSEVVGEDHTGQQFRVDYTGSAPAVPFAAGQIVRFVGHIHGSDAPYLHALQVYGQ